MTKHINYSILIFFTLIVSSCGVNQKNVQKINYENNKTKLIRIALEDFLIDNNEFFQFQKEYRIEKIYIRKKFGLASGMFDYGIPQKTIALPLKRKNLPKNYKSFKYRLLSDSRIETLEKKLESFQYIYLEYLYFTEVKATLNIRLLKIINGQQNSKDLEYKFVKENNNWKITPAKKNGVEQRIIPTKVLCPADTDAHASKSVLFTIFISLIPLAG